MRHPTSVKLASLQQTGIKLVFFLERKTWIRYTSRRGR